MLMRWPSALGSFCLTMTASSAEQGLKGVLSDIFIGRHGVPMAHTDVTAQRAGTVSD